jgi:hypothetical protein
VDVSPDSKIGHLSFILVFDVGRWMFDVRRSSFIFNPLRLCAFARDIISSGKRGSTHPVS